MEVVSSLSGRWVEIAAAVYLIGMILYGHYKGFIRLAVSVAALLITLLAVRFALPYVTDWLKTSTPIYGTITESIEKAVGLDEIMESMDGEIQEKAAERTAIEELELPDQLKRLLVENNNSQIYEKMGVNLFREYVSGYLADTIVRLVVFVLLFLIIYILLHVAVIWLDLIAKLPILSGLNQIAGAILGGLEALIFLWIMGLVLTLFSGTEFGRMILSQVEASVWLSFLYDHNMLAVLVVGLLQTVF